MSPHLSCTLFIFLIFAISVNAQNTNSAGDSSQSSSSLSSSSSSSSSELSSQSSSSSSELASQSSQQQDQQQNQQPTETTTDGLLGSLTPYLKPLTILMYETLDSVLRNVFRVSLPCTIYDFTRLDIQCQPLNKRK